MSTAARSEWRAEGGDDGQKKWMRQRARGAAEVVNIGQSSNVVKKTYFVGKDRWLSCGKRAGERRKRRRDR
jgi:hypothetical protein